MHSELNQPDTQGMSTKFHEDGMLPKSVVNACFKAETYGIIEENKVKVLVIFEGAK